jgi:hypothetical protein
LLEISFIGAKTSGVSFPTMNLNFLMLMAAAGILRYLAIEAKRTFGKRLENLLPHKLSKSHLAVLREHPQHFSLFRTRVLPFSALQIVFNALSCVCFIAGLWLFPPSALSSWDLLFMRYGSLLIVPLAFVVDVFIFARLFWVTLTGKNEADQQP